MRVSLSKAKVVFGLIITLGVSSPTWAETGSVTTDGEQVPQQTRAQQLMGATAPKLAELTDSVLYGDVWARPELSRRDRSLVTVSALIALNRPDQLRSHIRLARKNGVTETELVETITHLAFYSGWPNSVTAVRIAEEVFAE